jgi:Protein of unknown function (DUF4236)
MGYFRFRRSIKIARGVRWNIGKKGSSISLGGHGLTHTISAKGSRTTVGIPGTGLSYTQVHPHSNPTSMSSSPPLPAPSASSQPPTKSNASKVFYVLGLILLAIWLLGKLSEQGAPTSSPPYPVSSVTPSVLRSMAATAPPISSYTGSGKYLKVPALPKYSASPLSTAIPRALPVETPAYSSQLPTAAPSSVLAQTPIARQLPALTPIPTYRVVKINHRDTLNLRAGPGSTYPTVALIRPDARGIKLGTRRAVNGSTMWQEISVAGYTGWVNEIFIEPEVPVP